MNEEMRALERRIARLEQQLLPRDDSEDLKAWMAQEDAKMEAEGKMPPELPTLEDVIIKAAK